MVCFLALVLVLGLTQSQAESNITISERQALRCHSCEMENNFTCLNLRDCHGQDSFCVIAAIKIFPRFFLVSKQCSKHCPSIIVPPVSQGFLLKQRLPFVYIRCCKESGCNELGPLINDTTFREPLESASELRAGRAGQAMCLTLASAVLGLSLP